MGETVEEQTTQVMKNVLALLSSQGLGAENIVKTTVFLRSMGEFPKFNEVYREFVKAPFPARSTIEVSKLPKDALVEVETIAFFPNA